MATIDGKGRIRGKVGPVVYRVLNGKNIIQSKPGKVKQSKATQESSQEFAYIQNSAKRLRQYFYPAVQYLEDKKMANRFASQLYKILTQNSQHPKGERDLLNTDLSPIEGFQFNVNSPTDQFLKAKLEIQLNEQACLVIKVPALNLQNDFLWLSEASHAQIHVWVGAVDPENWKEINLQDFSIPLERGKPQIDPSEFTSFYYSRAV